MLSVAVLTYNKWPELLPDCLESIIPQLREGDELLVVDNGSDKPVPPSSQYRLVRLPVNRGNVGGQNACLDAAKFRLILFVSDDVRLWKGCLKELVDFYEKRPYIRVQPVIRNLDGTIQNAGMDYRWPGYGISRMKFKSTTTPIIASICYLTGSDRKFDESLPMAYEDVDMSLRSKGLCGVCPNAHATHLGNATLSYTKKDRWRFHQARLQVIDKHFRGIDRWTRKLAVHIIDRIVNITRGALARRT